MNELEVTIGRQVRMCMKRVGKAVRSKGSCIAGHDWCENYGLDIHSPSIVCFLILS